MPADAPVRTRPIFALLPLLLIGACVGLARGPAVPAPLEGQATVLGMSDIRSWGDEADPVMIRNGLEAYTAETAWRARMSPGSALPPAAYLAISGGGEDGAFGAGFLAGWSDTGTRPTFKLVTGISTGALIAPFAFLGPAYDEQVRQVYTEISADDVLVRRTFIGAFFEDAAADTAPLRRTMERFVTQSMLDAIAVEHEKGRMLLIGTTDLDARRPVIWDIGKLAASHHPRALELFRNILVASTALPAAFPPVMIDVEVSGKHYQEMHVDGGATAQVFVHPPSLDLSQWRSSTGELVTRERTLYVIRNARLDPNWAQVDRWTLSIAQRAVSSLTQTQGLGDLYRIYLETRRDNIDFNLAYIPSSFTIPYTKPYDPAYMKPLYDLGYAMARRGYSWKKVPPGFGQQAPDVPTELLVKPIQKHGG